MPFGRGWLPALQLAPALLYFVAFFLGPILFLIGMSFLTFRNSDFYPELTLRNYVDVLTSETFWLVFARTVLLSLLATLLALALAYAYAYVLTFVFPRQRQILYFLVLVSLFGGYLVRIYAWRTILGAEGLINGGLLALGVIHTPIREILNSPFAVVLALVNFLVPLAVLPIYAAMQNVSAGLIEAARDLGAGRLDVTRRVVFPLVMPGVAVAFAFCFISSAGEFALPALLGGTDTQFVGNQIGTQFSQTFNWPLGAAMSVTLIGSALVVSIIAAAVLRRVVR